MDEYIIYFLPWAGAAIKKTIKIGPITFWPYFSESNQRISNPKVKSYLDKFFKSYVDLQGKPVDTIIMCSYDDKDFHQLTENEYNDLRKAVDILVFAAIAPEIEESVCENNRSLTPPTSNVFELLTFNFSPGNDCITIKNGSNYHVGIKIGEISFPKPLEAARGLWSTDKELIKGFGKCFSAKLPQNERERLFRSLEWFRLAHVEGSQVSDFSKVVMMATAFEILFDFSEKDHNKSGKLTKCVEKYLVTKSSHSEEFIIKKREFIIKKERKLVPHTLAGWWAWDFYKLRDKIVHGDSVSLSDLKYNKGWITYLIVANLVFWECIKRELFKYECINDHLRIGKILLNGQVKGPFANLIADLTKCDLEFEAFHDALGWLKEKEGPNSS